MKITYSAAASLDGFIAKANGDVGWLDELNIAPAETGLEEFFASVDGLVMGRKTYDFVFQYGTWPYESKPTWICTSHLCQRCKAVISHAIQEQIGLAMTRSHKLCGQHKCRVRASPLATG